MSGTADEHTPAETPAIEQHGDDLEAVLGAAWDEASSDAPAPEETSSAFAASQRGADGRFVSEAAASPSVSTTEATPSAPEPPSFITDKDAWSAAPQAVRDAILLREKEVSETAEKANRATSEYEPVRREIEKHRPMLAALGLDEATAVRNLLTAQAALQDRPAEVIAQLARQYRVDLTQFIPREEPKQHQDPAVRELREQVARLTQQLETRAQQEQQSTVQSHQAQIAAFAKDHPHFEDVRNIMGALVQTGQAAALQSAYDMACHASPPVRAKIAEEGRRAASAKSQQEAETARNKARSITPSRAAAGSEQRRAVPSNESVEDTMRAVWDSFEGAA